MPIQSLSERKRLLALVLIMACVAMATVGISIWVLYRAAFEEERARLIELAQSQARLIEAVARFDALYSREDHPGGAAAATLSQVVDAYKVYQGFGKTGEFVVAKREGNMMVFLLDHREDLDRHSAPHPPAPVAFDSDLAEPVRRALNGQTGTVVAPDYRGVTVLAAYEPVAVLNLGLVAKIDLSEVHAPFIDAGIVSGVGAVFVILLGVPLFRRVFDPVVERLEETVANLANAQRIARLGNWNWNIVTNELRWSDEIYRIFGLEPQEFGATYEAFVNSVHPDDRKMVQEAVDGALNDKEPYAIDHRIVLPDGEERVVHEQAEVTFDDAGKAARMSGTVQDITERKESEKALVEKTRLIQLLQTIAVAANEASSVDEAMQICIDAVCAHTGWPVGHVYTLAEGDAGDLAPTKLWHLDHPEKFKTFRKVTERTRFARGIGLPGRVLASGEPAWITDVTKDANFPRAKLAEDIGVKAGFGFPVMVGTAVVAVLEFFSPDAAEPDEDMLEAMRHVGTQLGRVVERARAIEDIRRLNEELEQRVVQRTAELAGANAELEAFAYSVSHDLRAPLRSMDGFSQAVLEDYAGKLDAEGRDYLQRIRRASQHMAQLIEDILTLSRVTRSELDRSKVDLSGMAEAVAAELRKTDFTRDADFDIAPGVVADGDGRLLRVVLENLLGNAWKFTSKHPKATIAFGVTETGGEPAYFVRDDGAGFDMAYADKLFQPFQRLHSATDFEGTGIGLATVARIVARHGGRAWAEAAVEQGATTYFTLST